LPRNKALNGLCKPTNNRPAAFTSTRRVDRDRQACLDLPRGIDPEAKGVEAQQLSWEQKNGNEASVDLALFGAGQQPDESCECASPRGFNCEQPGDCIRRWSIAMSTCIVRVGPLGMTAYELNLLKCVCRLSQHAGRRIGHQVVDLGQEADIFVVATDDPKSVADWRARDPQALIPFVSAGPLPAGMANGVHSPRPLLASRLLAAMDICASRLQRLQSADAEPNPGVERVLRPHPLAPLASRSTLPPRRGRSILIVDDSAVARMQIEQLLLGMKLEAHCVASGEEALGAVDNFHFDLILLDVMLPGTDGYQVCRAIKKNPRTKNISVIMLTGKTSPFDRIRGKLAGCDTYLTKPVNRADFTAAMEKYLSKLSLGAAFSRPPDVAAVNTPAPKLL
jgi:two-component system, cell cycle response regulator